LTYSDRSDLAPSHRYITNVTTPFALEHRNHTAK
jgi:hypothetical protein